MFQKMRNKKILILLLFFLNTSCFSDESKNLKSPIEKLSEITSKYLEINELILDEIEKTKRLSSSTATIAVNKLQDIKSKEKKYTTKIPLEKQNKDFYFSFQDENTPSSSFNTKKINKTKINSIINNAIGKGQWTIVEAWHSKCKVCMFNMTEIVDSIDTYSNTDFFGISLDENSMIVKDVIKKYKINFPILISSVKEFDSYVQKVANKRLTGLPVFMIFSPEGKLIAYQSGAISPEQLKAFIKNYAN